MKNTYRALLDNCLIAGIMMLAAFFVISTIYGGIINHTTVPLADTWDGAIGFYLDSKSDLNAWWRQHYDHRIPLAKLIFWLDLELTNGGAAIYLPTHIFLLFLLAYTYLCFYRKIVNPAEQNKRNTIIAIALCLVFAFSWMQRENIVWEFQSEFILAYLIPLLAFFFYAKSLNETKPPLFALSLLLAWLSAYTMANGILVLPLLAVAGIFFRDSIKRVILIIALSALSIAVYFIGYEKTPGSSNGLLMLVSHPLKIISYALIYLGNPIYTATHSKFLTLVATTTVLSYLSYAWLSALKNKQNPFISALLVYAMYICMTASLTAFGRSHVSLELAASSRYTTPGLTFWMATTLTALSRASYFYAFYPKLLRGVFAISSLLFLNFQISAFYYAKTVTWVPFNKEISALSLQLNIYDKKARRMLFPLSDSRDAFFERTRQSGLSIFSEKQMYPAALVGSKPPQEWKTCSIHINNAEIVDEAKNAYRLRGRVLDAAKYKYVIFSNAEDVATGIALLGTPNFRDDLTEQPKLSWLMNVTNPYNFVGYSFGNDVSHAYCK